MSERKPDRVYVLTERQFIESVLSGAGTRGYLPAAVVAEVQRCAVEHADNGGVVLRIWAGQAERVVALEPQVLQPLLRQYEGELPGKVPTLKEVKAWPEPDLLAVSEWVRVLHARANPIEGMAIPEPPEQPLVLFEAQPEPPEPAKPAKKKRVRVHKETAKRFNREQADKIAKAAGGSAFTGEVSDPRERPGGGP